VENEWNCACTPSTYLHSVLIKHMDTFDMLYSAFGKSLCTYKWCWKLRPRASNNEPVSRNFSISLRTALRCGTGVLGIFQQIAPGLNRYIYCLLERPIQQEKHVPQLKEPWTTAHFSDNFDTDNQIYVPYRTVP
jgi:hypothetical protein